MRISWTPVRASTVLAVACGALLLHAMPVFAVQEHRGGEGLAAHQLGHLLLVAGCFLLLHHSRAQAAAPGWRQFRIFLLLLVGWNILTFTGHVLDPTMTADRFLVSDGRRLGLRVAAPLDLLFYLSRLDHLILVPAFFLLLRAIDHWRRQP